MANSVDPDQTAPIGLVFMFIYSLEKKSEI